MSTAAVPGGRSRAVPRPAGRSRPSVRVVPATYTPARAPFVIVVLVVLSLGLGALLLLNTLLAQGSFTLHTLNDRVDALADKEQALQQRASELAAPHRLARRAQDLGMVPSQNPAFLTADGGKILGEPVPAAARVQPAPVVGSDDVTPQRSGAGDSSAGDEKTATQSGDTKSSSSSNSNSSSSDGGDKQQTGSGDPKHDGGDGGADQ